MVVSAATSELQQGAIHGPASRTGVAAVGSTTRSCPCGECIDIDSFSSSGPQKLADSLALAVNQLGELQECPAHDVKAQEAGPVPAQLGTPVPGLSDNPNPASQCSPLSQNGTFPHDELAPVEARSGLLPAPASSRLEPLRDGSTSSTKMEFLLVDDNIINLKILSSCMGKLGQSYQTATNGQEAVDAYKRAPGLYRCIFMDISMPIIDGLEASRLIRAHEEQSQLQPVTIIGLTAMREVRDGWFDSLLKKTQWRGLTCLLQKPIRLEAVSSVLQSRGLLC